MPRRRLALAQGFVKSAGPSGYLYSSVALAYKFRAHAAVDLLGGVCGHTNIFSSFCRSFSHLRGIERCNVGILPC